MSGERQQATGRSRPTWWLLGLVGGVVVAGVGGGLIGAAVASPNSPGGSASASASAASCDVTPVAEKVLPSVVTIQATPAAGQGGSTGSGEVYKSDGYILTNNHVIAPALAAGRSRCCSPTG